MILSLLSRPTSALSINLSPRMRSLIVLLLWHWLLHRLWHWLLHRLWNRLWHLLWHLLWHRLRHRLRHRLGKLSRRHTEWRRRTAVSRNTTLCLWITVLISLLLSLGDGLLHHLPAIAFLNLLPLPLPSLQRAK